MLAAVAWVGGSIFLVVALAPALRGAELRAQAPAVIRASGRRFRSLTYGAFAVFVITGAILLWHRGFLLTPVLVGKLVLVATAFAISGIHDFRIGPSAGAAARRGDTVAAARARALSTLLGRLNLGLTVAIVVLSTAVARGY